VTDPIDTDMTDIVVSFDDLNDDDARRVIKLCLELNGNIDLDECSFKATIFYFEQLGLLEVRGNMVSLTEKGKATKNLADLDNDDPPKKQ